MARKTLSDFELPIMLEHDDVDSNSRVKYLGRRPALKVAYGLKAAWI